MDELLLRLLQTPLGGLELLRSAMADRTGFLVARSHFALRALGRERLAPFGIEPHHFAVLAIVRSG